MDDTTIPYKTCSYPGCGQTYPATPQYFARQRNGKYGVTAWCKACKSLHAKSYATDHFQLVLKQKSVSRRKHRESRNVRGKLYYHANRQRILAEKAAWKANNRDKVRAYYQRNRERTLLQVKAYRQTAAGKASHAASNAKRRTLLGVAATLTKNQWVAIKAHYKYTCVYCGKKPKALTMDHIIPLSKGGTHTFDNVVPACRSCNSAKHDLAPLVPVQPLLLLPH